jgi:hypothetical protein
MRLPAILAPVVLAFCLATDAASQITGTLQGRVVTEQQQPMGGVVVQAVGVGERYRTQTDERGIFRFRDLNEGTYTVSATHPGFQPASVRGVRVVSGQTNTVVVRMEVTPIQLEGIDVLATPLKIEKANTEFGTRIGREELSLQPIARDPKDLIIYTPGARPGHVWGGASFQANNYRIDGISANHPGMGGDFVQPSMSWIERIEVRGLGAGAEHGNFQGGIINVVTKSGTNRFQGGARVNAEASGLNATNLSSDEIGSEILGRREAELEFRGPLLRDRLYFFVAGHVTQDDTRYISHLFRAEGRYSPVLLSREDERFFGKLSFVPTEADTVELSGGAIRVRADQDGNTGYERPEATLRRTTPSDFATLTWKRHFGTALSFEGQVASFSLSDRGDPYAGENVPGIGFYSNRDRFNAFNNAPMRFRHEATSRSASATFRGRFRTGTVGHEWTVGGEQVSGTWIDQRLRNGDMTWRPARMSRFDPDVPETWPFADFIPIEVGGEVDVDADVSNTAVFAENLFRIGGRVAVVPGVRFGTWTGRIAPRGGEDRFTAVETSGLDPRLGLILDPTGRGAFVVKAHLGRYHQGLVTQFFDRAAGAQVFNNQQLWYLHGFTPRDPRAAISAAEWEELRRSGQLRLTEEVILNETGPVVDYRQPYVDQGILGVERLIGSRVKLEALYVTRRNHQMVGLVDRNRDSNYTRFENVRVLAGTDSVRFRGRPLVLPHVDVPNHSLLHQLRLVAEYWPTLGPPPPGMSLADTVWLKEAWNPDYELTNVPDGRRQFDQVQVIAQTFQSGWSAAASVVWTQLNGNYDSVTGYADPAGRGAGPFVRVNELVNRFGPLRNFSDLELKVNVQGELGRGFRGGAFWTRARGDRYTPHFTFSTVELDYSAAGGQPLARVLFDSIAGHTMLILPRGSLRHNRTASFDFRLEREVRMWTTVGSLTLDVFNLFNFDTVTDINTMVNKGKNYWGFLGDVRDPQDYYAAVQQRVPPRTIRLGTAVRF